MLGIFAHIISFNPFDNHLGRQAGGLSYSHFTDREAFCWECNSLSNVTLPANSSVYGAAGYPGFKELFRNTTISCSLVHFMSSTLPNSSYSINTCWIEYSFGLTTTLLTTPSRPTPNRLALLFLYSGLYTHLQDKRWRHHQPLPGGTGKNRSVLSDFPRRLFPHNIREPHSHIWCNAYTLAQSSYFILSHVFVPTSNDLCGFQLTQWGHPKMLSE